MDIKLKNNTWKVLNKKIQRLIKNLKINMMRFFKIIFRKVKNISVNNRVIILSLCISFIPILCGITISHPYINRNDRINSVGVRNEIVQVNDYIDKLNYYLEDSNGTFTDEAINSQIQELKDENFQKLTKAKEDLETYKNLNNIDESEEKIDDKDYASYKKRVIDAENNYNKSEDEYKINAVKILNDKLEDIESGLKECVNVQYFLRSKNGKIIANIYGKSINEILLDNYKYSDYIAYSTVWNDYPQETYISDSMKPFSDLISINGVTTKVIRISKDLKERDAIYNALKGVDRNNNILFMSSICVLLDLTVLFVLIFSTTKNLLYEENIISKLYARLFVEIKIIILIFVCITLWSVYEYSKWKVDLIMWLTVGISSIFLYAIISDLYRKIILCDNKDKKLIYTDKSIIMRIYRTKYINRKNNNFNSNIRYRISNLLLCFIVYYIIICYTLINVGYHKIPWGGENDTTISFLVISIIITVAVLIYMIIKCINLCNIKNGLEKIIQGNYTDNMEIYGFGIEKNIADNIANIKEGFSRAIDDAVKSEKMKSELITNVSHDLKTPLTSIINYVDLLSKEGVTEEDKEKYLSILNERSQRLKVLIEDLFEASKAASGALVLNYETLDPVALIRQVLGELNDKIMSSGLEFIKNVPEEKVYIVADGRKTFRIIQNLISNILKYSLDKSRVYIDVIEEEDNILMVFKNISRYRLNCGEEELMERFKRGDSSRTTQGNGLGLSIAKSLTEAQGGKFNINIDGDLFKAEVSLKKGRRIY